MSSFRYDVLKALSAYAPKLVFPASGKPGMKSYSITIVEHVTHRARVEAANETDAWQQFILGRFVERFRQVRSEMSEIVVKQESAS